MIGFARLAAKNGTSPRNFARLFSLSRTCFSDVELTSVRYPSLERKPFAQIEDSDVSFFKAALGDNGVTSDEDEVKPYNTDWLKTCRGMSSLVLHPKSTDQVSKILSHCYERNLAVCPQGGNTGLVGGSVPVFDEIIVSMSRMNNILGFDPISGILQCEAGCILESLDQYVGKQNFIMPLDLGAKGSCQIGGNLSTNAGGLRVIRYGSLHNSVLGLEMVMPNGEVLPCLSQLKKDNTGYDLKRLMIGSEGTLGIITKVSIQCPVRSKATNLAFLGCKSFEKVLEAFARAKLELGEILSACEFMDYSAMDSVVTNLHLSNPISDNPFYIVIETSGANGEHDKEKLDNFLSVVMDREIVTDGTVASNEHQIQNLWQLRERIAESHLPEGYTYKYDVSVPVSQLYQPVEIMRAHMGSSVFRCCGYGHLGDGNLHMNMTSPLFDHGILSRIEPYMFEVIKEMKGSISAEHGLGLKKGKYIHYSKPKIAVDMMKGIKAMVDPKGIMNPYKVLPT